MVLLIPQVLTKIGIAVHVLENLQLRRTTNLRFVGN